MHELIETYVLSFSSFYRLNHTRPCRLYAEACSKSPFAARSVRWIVFVTKFALLSSCSKCLSGIIGNTTSTALCVQKLGFQILTNLRYLSYRPTKSKARVRQKRIVRKSRDSKATKIPGGTTNAFDCTDDFRTTLFNALDTEKREEYLTQKCLLLNDYRK